MACALYGDGDFGIFTVDDAGDFERRLPIEIGRGGVCFLGAEAAQLYASGSVLRSFANKSCPFQGCFPKASMTAS
jgi:hypothetical protein